MAEVLHLAKKGSVFGLKIPDAKPDMKAMHRRKLAVIADFTKHREQQLLSGKYDMLRARAKFEDAHTLSLSDGTKIRGEKILISTGSVVSMPPIPGLAETPAWTSDEVLELDFVPESVIILGGGIVACELGQFLTRIGTKVTLIQRAPDLLSSSSPDVSGVVAQAFRDEGMEVITSTRLDQISGDAHRVAVTFTKEGESITKNARYLFNALGREPNIKSLNLEAAGVEVDSKKRVKINRFQQTNVTHIYAGGDVCGPHEIVHIAVAQGELSARHAFGVPNLKPINEDHLLHVVFTDPQLASIGLTEKKLKEQKRPYLAASYPFNDHGKSILMDANYGFVKVLADPKDGRILGAEIVGKDAGELIHCFSGPLVMNATVNDLLQAPWYHPTLSEIVTYPLEEIADKLAEAKKD
jgi:pyruvate/2-oxoglutarate dehydrogenase complex dihydrolipoamide dehydrogenase (E3) component